MNHDHPWRKSYRDREKLKAARAAAARRRDRKWHAEEDELSKNLKRAAELRYYRRKLGAPEDAPIAKPWGLRKNFKARRQNQPDQPENEKGNG